MSRRSCTAPGCRCVEPCDAYYAPELPPDDFDDDCEFCDGTGCCRCEPDFDGTCDDPFPETTP